MGIPLGTFLILPSLGAGWVLPKLLVFAFVACLTGILLILRRGRLLLPFFGISGWFLLAYIGVVMLSPLWAISPVQSILGASPRFLGVFTHIILFTVGYVAFLLSAGLRGKKVVLIAILLSHAGVVLYGFLQVVSLDPFGEIWAPGAFLGRPFSTLGQPNALGSFLLLTTPLVFLCALQSRGMHRWWKGALVVAGLLLLLMTASRAAYLGLVAMVLLAFAFRWRTWSRGTTRNQRLLVGIVVISFLMIGGLSLRERFLHPTEAGRSASVRLLVWSSIPSMLRERPWGYGLESMGLVFPRFFRPEIYGYEKLTAGVDRAHSLPLDLLVTLGPAGFFAFFGFLLSLFSLAFRHRRDDGVLLCLLALISYTASLLFGFETVVTGVFFWMSVGFLGALLREQEGGTTRTLSDRASLFLAIAITAVTAVSLVFNAGWMRARLTMREAELKFREGKRMEAMQGYLRAREYFPFDREILVQGAETALFAMEGTVDAELRSSLQSVARGMVDASMRLSRNRDGMVFLLRAWLSALEGEEERMEEDIAQARALLPMSMTTHRIAAHSYGILGMRTEEEREKRELQNLLPPWWRDRSSAEGRILWKENPWLSDFLPSDDSPP